MSGARRGRARRGRAGAAGTGWAGWLFAGVVLGVLLAGPGRDRDETPPKNRQAPRKSAAPATGMRQAFVGKPPEGPKVSWGGGWVQP